MKNTDTSRWKLGLMVAFSICILVFFIFFIGKNKNVFSSTITLNSLFEDVNGLAVGNNVRLAGIKVGTVTDVEIMSDSLVRVTVIVEKSSQKFIKADAKMSIGSDGLMGDKVISIVKGSPDTTQVKDGAVLASVKPLDTGKLLASVTHTAHNAEIITTQIAAISTQMNGKKGIVGRMLNDSAFANHIVQLVRNLEHASGGLSENMEAAKHSFLFRKYYKKKAEKENEETEQLESTESEEEKGFLKRRKKREEKE